MGKWTSKNGPAIYGTARNDFEWHIYATFTQRGHTAYAHVINWPGDTPAEEWLTFYQPPSVISLGGWRAKVKSVRLLVGDKPLTFTQNDLSLRITGLPATAPDEPATVIAIECDGQPAISHEYEKNSAALQCGG